MIVYHREKTGFCQDVESGRIDDIVLDQVQGVLGHGVGASEIRSWHQSLSHMGLVLADPDIPDDAGVALF